jgi:7-cyano-7-deazaguanine reductase
MTIYLDPSSGSRPRPTGTAGQAGELVAVPNPEPGRDYEVRCQTPEFTCVCPMTAQPDFATVTITYVPDRWIVELKSLKLYLWQYRQVGTFHEAVTNKILDDLVAALHPRRMTVHTDWLVRGGIHTTVEARHCATPGEVPQTSAQ